MPLDSFKTLYEKRLLKKLMLWNDPTHSMRHYFDPATGVEDFYSLKQIQTIIRPPSYPLLCQFLMKIIIVINLVCACVKTSAEDDDFQSLSKGERECVFYSLELLRCYVCTIQFWLFFTTRSNNNFNFPPGWIKYMLCRVMLLAGLLFVSVACV